MPYALLSEMSGLMVNHPSNLRFLRFFQVVVASAPAEQKKMIVRVLSEPQNAEVLLDFRQVIHRPQSSGLGEDMEETERGRRKRPDRPKGGGKDKDNGSGGAPTTTRMRSTRQSHEF